MPRAIAASVKPIPLSTGFLVKAPWRDVQLQAGMGYSSSRLSSMCLALVPLLCARTALGGHLVSEDRSLHCHAECRDLLKTMVWHASPVMYS